MTTVQDIIDIMQSIAREEDTLASYDDNVGLILGRREGRAERILCCLDLTNSVIDEAIRLKVDMIISHHPPIRTPLRKITDDRFLKAAENRIALYAAHTNLDIAINGINDYVASVLGIYTVEDMEEGGLGRVGNLSQPLTARELAAYCEKELGDVVRLISRENKEIERVAVINGGGGDISHIERAIEMKCDAYITADVKYHTALYAAEKGLTIIEPTHYAMEHIYILQLVIILTKLAMDEGINAEFMLAESEESPYMPTTQD